MRLALALLTLLAAAALARARPWGGSCAPAVAGPRFLSPILLPVAQPAGRPAPMRRPPALPGTRPGTVAKSPALPPCDCPEGSPCGGCPGGCDCVARQAQAADEFPTGVNRSRLGKTPRYTIGGAEVSREEAVRSIGQLADDSARSRLTLFGSNARTPLRAALLADPAVASAVLCQDYPGGHWAVARHASLGDVSVYLQRPDGTVLHKGAGGDVAAMSKAIKQALGLLPPDQPVPTPGPDGRTPAPPAPDSLAAWWKRLNDDAAKVPPLAWAGVAGLGFLFLRRK